MSSQPTLPTGLPPQTQTTLRDFVTRAQESFGANLISAVLFGSAAEARLRQHSDVNLILVLKSFSPEQAAALSPALTLTRAAIDLQVMFLAEAEIPAAFECFAQKFADILRRHFVVYGPDPFAGASVNREDEIRRTRQVLLNLTMRLRERYTLLAANSGLLQPAITDSIGPIRTCAAALHEIEGHSANSPKEAFAATIASLNTPEWNYLPEYFSAVREQGLPASPAPAVVIAHLLALSTTLRQRLESHL